MRYISLLFLFVANNAIYHAAVATLHQKKNIALLFSAELTLPLTAIINEYCHATQAYKSTSSELETDNLPQNLPLFTVINPSETCIQEIKQEIEQYLNYYKNNNKKKVSFYVKKSYLNPQHHDFKASLRWSFTGYSSLLKILECYKNDCQDIVLSHDRNLHTAQYNKDALNDYIESIEYLKKEHADFLKIEIKEVLHT